MVSLKIEQQKGWKKQIYDFLYRVKKRAFKNGRSVPIVDQIIFNQFRQELGGRVKFIVSGGAALSAKCSEVLRTCLNIPILQGYGLTETCGGATIMELDDKSLGMVGAPIYGVSIKLVDAPEFDYFTDDQPYPRGEIWVKGPNVSPGYFPNDTNNTFNDQWCATGDIGMIHPNGCIEIIDRKKNLIKPPHGEYISLEKLESIYKNSSYISNICILATPFREEIIALISPYNIGIFALSETLKLNHDHWATLLEDPLLKNALLQDFQKIAQENHLQPYEYIRSLHITSEEWTSPLLTPTLKLNRHEIMLRYKDEIELLYNLLEST